MVWQVVVSDVLEWAKAYNGPKFHAAFFDPPYNYAFMGTKWDSLGTGKAYQAWATEWATALRENCLLPGASLVSYAGTKTWHRLACGLEDAGMECWDVIQNCGIGSDDYVANWLVWLYGTGMPKQGSVDRLIDKQAFAAWLDESGASLELTTAERGTVIEIAVQARELPKTLIETYPKPIQARYRKEVALLDSVLKRFWGQPGLPPGCRETDHTRPARRVGYSLTMETGTGSRHYAWQNPVGASTRTIPATSEAKKWDGYHAAGLKPAHEPLLCFRAPSPASTRVETALRFGTGMANIDACCLSNETMWARSGAGVRGGAVTTLRTLKRRPGGSHPIGRYPSTLAISDAIAVALNASGAPTHCFYCPKPPVSERNAGLVSECLHPTMKSIRLALYIATLLLPPIHPSRIVVPFSGVGSEMVGCVGAGWDEVVGIEQKSVYAEISRARLHYWDIVPSYKAAISGWRTHKRRQRQKDTGQLSLELL